MSSVEEDYLLSVLDDIKRKLPAVALKGDWVKVLAMCKIDPEILTVKITVSGETALHLAVADRRDAEIVERLLKVINSLVRSDALRVKNGLGNTPLHLAAELGNIRVCKFIASADRELIGLRNYNGETPFFLAVLHGRKDVFLFLDHIISEEDSPDFDYYYLCRRNDGDTILHCAIDGEYFDLAFRIICRCKKLVHCINERGFTPLHVLASKPSAFKSGSHLGLFSQIIYCCIFVDKLGRQTGHFHPEHEREQVAKYPKNYERRKNELGQQPHSDVEHQRQEGMEAQGHNRFRATYITCFEAFKFMSMAMVNIFGLGMTAATRVTKQKHVWSVQVLEELLSYASSYDYAHNGQIPPERTSVDEMPRPSDLPRDEKASLHDSKGNKSPMTETPILIAAKNGITEMVDKILRTFPVAAQDINCDEKSILLLAVENRQPHVYELLHKMRLDSGVLFRKKDKYGNSALHLAATLGEHGTWFIPAVQMQWEIKWFEYVKKSMPTGFFGRFDNNGKTPENIFAETHRDLIKRGGEWLTKTAESCSFVGALVATIAFTTSTTFPGGVTQDTGTPILKGEPAFKVFAISSLVALSFSVTSVVMFLIILASRYQGNDFRNTLPRKLHLGLASLFISITAMLISFCAGHFFLLRDKLQHPALTVLVYALACSPASFAILQFPLYLDFILATFKKFPPPRKRFLQ